MTYCGPQDYPADLGLVERLAPSTTLAFVFLGISILLPLTLSTATENQLRAGSSLRWFVKWNGPHYIVLWSSALWIVGTTVHMLAMGNLDCSAQADRFIDIVIAGVLLGGYGECVAWSGLFLYMWLKRS